MGWADAASVTLAVGFPWLARFAIRRGWFPGWLSSIIACYGIGIVVSNLRLWSINAALLEGVAGAAMLVGLPLLLFSVRLRESWRYAGKMLAGFALCCGAGLLCTGVVGYLMHGRVDHAWQIAGMLVGLYTGGTPNVLAIGLALDAPPEYPVLVQAADVLLGGAYLLGLVTFLPAVFARWYPASQPPPGATTDAARPDAPGGKWWVQLPAGLVVTALSAAITYLVTGGLTNLTVLILTLTTLSLLATLTPLPRRLGNSYPLGEYFILVFCVALGLMADFRALAADGMDLLYFSALALVSTTLLHLLLCKVFKLDRDTMMLSYVAGFYGPVFVVQVAAALENRWLLASGLAVSLLGFGIGNYLGVGLALLVRYLGGG